MAVQLYGCVAVWLRGCVAGLVDRASAVKLYFRGGGAPAWLLGWVAGWAL